MSRPTDKGRFAQTLDEVLSVIEADGRCPISSNDLDVVRTARPQPDIYDGLVAGVALAYPL